MSAYVCAEGISKSFGKQAILDHISIDFEKGKVYGITGRNGSGKTVFLKILCGLLPPNQGTVRVNGKTIGKDIDFPESVGAIIESPGFLPYWSGYKNLSYLASLRNRIGAAEIYIRCHEIGWVRPKGQETRWKVFFGYEAAFGYRPGHYGEPAAADSGRADERPGC